LKFTITYKAHYREGSAVYKAGIRAKNAMFVQ